ncbi:MAG: hypothetical protein E6J78_10190 [Deltaproteobacteria bacterium]|nr:MAG: hypothetical protein E6J78_10190 [Deltaproteobacteria bacterium]
MTARFPFAIAVALLLGCGESSPPSRHVNDNGRQHDIIILDTSGICIGPICVGKLLETLRLGPPAPPDIVSLPLGPIDPPPLPTDAPTALVAHAAREMTLAPPAPPLIQSQPLGPTRAPPTPSAATSACTSYTVGMQVLVISTNGNEVDLPAIKDALGYHTIPYSVWIATQNPGALTADKLASGCAGKYQGVILTTGALTYSPDGGATWRSALTNTEWLTLRSYEASFHAREISWYVYPGADQGLNPPSSAVDTSKTPINATLTAAGRNVFPYINTANSIPISMAWTYLSTPSDPKVTPLLVDSGNHSLISTRVTADGRETMALTFDSNPNLIHDLLLAHGLVEWVTNGIYLGEFRTYLTPQVDDLFIDDDIYGGGVYRITDVDFRATDSWQSATQAQAGNSAFRLALVFNGVGASSGDPLTDTVTALQANYSFIDHTWDHENLDSMGYDAAYAEFDQDNQLAVADAFTAYSVSNLVSPDVSGLTNPDVLQAASDDGVQFMVSDTSKESGQGQPSWGNPAPNIGLYSTIQPGILFLPRRPTNLYYNVTAPSEWVAEYNSFYNKFWGRNLSYSEVLDKESQMLFIYMLRGDLDAQMYHQPNLRAYDGTHTLIGDLHDAAFRKFRKYLTLPVLSPNMDDSGWRVGNTMARNASGLTATLTPGVSVSFTSPVTVEFVVSGVCTVDSEIYANRCITIVDVAAGQTVTMPLQ